MDQSIKVKEFWDNQAEQHGSECIATMPDLYLKQIEIKNIKEFLFNGAKILDIGCGNGYSTFLYAEFFNVNITGIDYSSKMIEVANNELKQKSFQNSSKVQFGIGDIRQLDIDDNSYDIVITDRCIQNLCDRNDQEKAIKEVRRILKPGGIFLMCENTEQGLNNLNKVRDCVGLEKIKPRWHNLFIDENHLKEVTANIFKLNSEIRFSSFYYLASRVINGKISQMHNETPQPECDINYVASLCSSFGDFGDYGLLKLFVFEK